MKGKLYAVGVGPGDPELLTLKAARVLSQVDAVVCPSSAKGKSSFALEIARIHIGKDAQIIEMTFPMEYEEGLMESCWRECASGIDKLLEQGMDVAFITLGDPMLYSTYINMMGYLGEPGAAEIIPGVNSFSLAAARTRVPLAMGEQTLSIVPLGKNENRIECALESADNIVIMKPSALSGQLAREFSSRGLEGSFVLASMCGTQSEEISRDIERLSAKRVPYLSTIIVKKGGIK
ncbi:precorrin-2 C(20)-methyltransferase [Peptoclostridium acidaminophilum]|uniref:precorrin-2 C(20)-methyltransferase n=1 Tax=Peptoclostridium acidaminophilum TaxID=1731 RepID=UPI00046D1BC2|nr:precorrin-2 C(20)-methyltransferase [Peptoclostridium acidaminophilum]